MMVMLMAMTVMVMMVMMVIDGGGNDYDESCSFVLSSYRIPGMGLSCIIINFFNPYNKEEVQVRNWKHK